MIATAHYNLDNLNQMDIENVSNDNIGWAIAERFPTKEYLNVKKVFDKDEDPINALGTWQEDEDYRDYIDMDSYNAAPIVFTLSIEDDCEAADLYTTNEIRLHAKDQEDIDYIQFIVEETVACTVKIEAGEQYYIATVFDGFHIEHTLHSSKEKAMYALEQKWSEFKKSEADAYGDKWVRCKQKSEDSFTVKCGRSIRIYSVEAIGMDNFIPVNFDLEINLGRKA